MPVHSWQTLNKILTDALHSYNELNAAMDLVLFEDAMSHICKINRILESPRGNALLGKYFSSSESFNAYLIMIYL